MAAAGTFFWGVGGTPPHTRGCDGSRSGDKEEEAQNLLKIYALMCLYVLMEYPKLYRDSNLAREIRWAYYISTLLKTADSIV